MITRMVIKFEKTKEDFCQGMAVKGRLEELVEKYGDRIINRIWTTAMHFYDEFDEETKKWKWNGPYYDYVVYYNDNYENLVMKALRPYWALE